MGSCNNMHMLINISALMSKVKLSDLSLGYIHLCSTTYWEQPSLPPPPQKKKSSLPRQPLMWGLNIVVNAHWVRVAWSLKKSGHHTNRLLAVGYPPLPCMQNSNSPTDFGTWRRAGSEVHNRNQEQNWKQHVFVNEWNKWTVHRVCE